MSSEPQPETSATVSEILRDAWSKIPTAIDMGDSAGKVGTVCLLGGLIWFGMAPFLCGVGAVLILVSVAKGLR